MSDPSVAQSASRLSLATQRWRPILLGLVVFLLCNALFTLLVSCSPLNARFNFKYGNFLPAKLQQLKAYNPASVNVLFLGTSQTNNGFIPAMFDRRLGSGVKSFNLGLPNNRYDLMLAYLRLHQRRYGKPRWVFIELSPTIQEKASRYYYLPALYYRTLLEQEPGQVWALLSNPGLADNVKWELLTSALSSLRQYRNTFSPLNLLEKVGGQLQRVALKWPGGVKSPTLAANSEGASVASLSVESSEQGVDDAPPAWVSEALLAGGWYPKTESPHMRTAQGVGQSVLAARKYYIDGQKAIHFEKLAALLAYCHQQGIPVVLVSWPNHPAFVREFQQSALAVPYQEGIQALLTRYPVLWVDLNRHVPAGGQQATAGLFADPRHLTPVGARQFTEILADTLSGRL